MHQVLYNPCLWLYLILALLQHAIDEGRRRCLCNDAHTLMQGFHLMRVMQKDLGKTGCPSLLALQINVRHYRELSPHTCMDGRTAIFWECCSPLKDFTHELIAPNSTQTWQSCCYSSSRQTVSGALQSQDTAWGFQQLPKFRGNWQQLLPICTHKQAETAKPMLSTGPPPGGSRW